MNNNKYICIKCYQSFNYKCYYDRYINRKNPCDKILKCNRCNKEFKLNRDLINHINRKIPCKQIKLEQEIRELKKI